MDSRTDLASTVAANINDAILSAQIAGFQVVVDVSDHEGDLDLYDDGGIYLFTITELATS